MKSSRWNIRGLIRATAEARNAPYTILGVLALMSLIGRLIMILR
jgi:hypothetical protein